MAVVVGTVPYLTTYNIPAHLLRWHSTFFDSEIKRLETAATDFTRYKKQKLSPEYETAVVVKGEHVQNQTVVDAKEDQSKILVGNKGDRDEGLVIKLPNVDQQTFEMFLKFAYMSFYPFEVDVPNAFTPVGGTQPLYSLPSTKPQTQESAREPAEAQGLVAVANVSTNRCPMPTPSPEMPTPNSAAAKLKYYQFVPPSVQAWLLGWSLGALRFMNHAMVHIHSGIGHCYQISPNLVHYIWQHAPQGCMLRKLILDFLVVYWGDSDPNLHRIDRHPALGQHWMAVMDLHQDLKTSLMLGFGSKKDVAPVQAYFVHPQLRTFQSVTTRKAHERTKADASGSHVQDSKADTIAQQEEATKEAVVSPGVTVNDIVGVKSKEDAVGGSSSEDTQQ